MLFEGFSYRRVSDYLSHCVKETNHERFDGLVVFRRTASGAARGSWLVSFGARAPPCAEGPPRGVSEERPRSAQGQTHAGTPGLAEDAPRIAELLELNGIPRWVAFEERFILAEDEGKLVAVLRFRENSEFLFLGLLTVELC
jgi:hypothetical protein